MTTETAADAAPTVVVDLDGTLCPERRPEQAYDELEPHAAMVAQLRALKAAGWRVVIDTARQMRTHGGNVGLITLHTAPAVAAWLKRHDIPCDELHVAKPWPAHGGFLIDDRAVRPVELLDLGVDGVRERLRRDAAALLARAGKENRP